MVGMKINDTLEWLHTESVHKDHISHEHRQSRKKANFAETVPVSEPIMSAASNCGITSLYFHQTKALESAKDGKNVVISTETASGKSLPYTLLTLERAIIEGSTTLYVASMKALINDQAKKFEEFASSTPVSSTPSVGIYTGDTSDDTRRQYRRKPPDVLLMTPELVHMSLLQYHNTWSRFLKKLDTIVVDEIHEFRGLFGSHMGLVFRRLNRLLESYNQDATYFCCSATIGNPVNHASQVTGQSPSQFTLIDTDASSRGERFWLLYNPPRKEDSSDTMDSEYNGPPPDWDEVCQRVYQRDGYQCMSCGEHGGVDGSAELYANHIVSPANGGTDDVSNLKTLCGSCYESEHGHSVEDGTPSVEDKNHSSIPGEAQTGDERKSNHPVSIRLFTELVARNHQTLVFTDSRQGTEEHVKGSINRLKKMNFDEFASKIEPYHAALTDNKRETIEDGIKTGEVTGVWSTDALELGIDIGGLDAVIIDGHPGTNMSLFQRTGRAGRGDEDCLILFVAAPTPLDQFCITHPSAIFDEPPAEAKVNITNPEILRDHVVSAADERLISIDDESYFGGSLSTVVSDLCDNQRLALITDNDEIRWKSTEDDTQHNMTLRGDFGTEYSLIDKTQDTKVGELNFPDVLRDCHPEAIYYHQKINYRIEEFNDTDAQVILRPIDEVSGHTQPLFNQSISVVDTIDISQNSETGIEKAEIGYIKIMYREELESYLQFDYRGDDNPTEHEINEQLPNYTLRTNGIFITLPESLENRMRRMTESQEAVLAGIHAIEHAMRSIFPLSVLCSTDDIMGLSVANHDQMGGPTIFIFDNIAGGAGLTQTGYERIGSVIQQTRDLIASCDCESGCPSCIHLNSCQSKNRVLNKELALFVLNRL